MAFTGVGPSEALGLGWEHVDLDAATLRVVRTVECKARAIIEDTKRPTRRRELPLVPELRATLRERWMAAGRPAAGLVFATRDGRPLHLDTLRECHFKPALERAKITRKARIYDLRHGFATAAWRPARMCGRSRTSWATARRGPPRTPTSIRATSGSGRSRSGSPRCCIVSRRAGRSGDMAEREPAPPVTRRCRAAEAWRYALDSSTPNLEEIGSVRQRLYSRNPPATPHEAAGSPLPAGGTRAAPKAPDPDTRET